MGTMLPSAELLNVITVGGTRYQTELLLSAEAIQTRVGQLAMTLAERYDDRGGAHILTVMNGALHFASDIRRGMQAANPSLALTSDQVKVSSYSGMSSSGTLHFQSPPSIDISGKDVLIVEDIFDSGLTLNWLTSYLSAQQPASLEVAIAFDKANPDRSDDALRSIPMHAAFAIGNEFVIGYGLDIDQYYRDLSGVYALSPLPAGV